MKKNVVPVALRVATVLKALAPAGRALVQVAADVVVLVKPMARLAPRLKENKHAATVTQKIPQGPERP